MAQSPTKSHRFNAQHHPSLALFIFLLLTSILPSFSSSSPQQPQEQRPWLKGIPTSLPLVSKTRVSHDTNRYKFSLSPATIENSEDPSSNNRNNEDLTLGISTCSCILVSPPNNPSIVRPYTPISKHDEKGTFELLVKTYPNGAMGREFENLKVGDSLNFWQIPKNIKVQYPFGHPKYIIMLAAGTGITPMYQALLRLFDDDDKQSESSNHKTRVILLYGSRSKKNIYFLSEMEEMKRKNPDRLKVIYCLSEEQEAQQGEDAISDNKGQVEKTNSMLLHQGQINKEAILSFCSEDMVDRNDGETCVWVCGPPSFYGDLCGPRDEEDVTGLLKAFGFEGNHVIKF